jgi:hypothetical protein
VNLSQLVEVLPRLVYMRRGELVIQFATPADFVARVAELSSVLTQLDQESSRTGDVRGRNKQAPAVSGTSSTRGQSKSESSGVSVGDGTEGAPRGDDFIFFG